MTKDDDLTTESLIIELQPFSPELINWCKSHPDFAEALKIIYPERFITLQAIITSHSPLKPQDQVIGFYAYDRKLKKFKQDFIVNVERTDTEFILYSVIPANTYGKYIRHINEFFATYSQGKYYLDTHHPKFEQLPQVVKKRGQQAIILAERLDKHGIKKLSKRELLDLYAMSKSIKKKTKRYPGTRI